MQVILREDVPSLGKAGEVVKVSEGYARNFLLPRKKVAIADKGSLKRLEQDKLVIEAKRAKAKEASEALASKISTLSVSIEKQAGEEDKIFGSVSTREIEKGLKAQGIEVDHRLIRLKTPIRAIGEYAAEIHLQSDVVASVKVIVVKK